MAGDMVESDGGDATRQRQRRPRTAQGGSGTAGRARSNGGRSLGALLPLALDTFVAREAEMAELAALLGRSRLVSVTGPSGVGKTRLALEAARVLGDGYTDGVVLAALAGTSSGDRLAEAVASALAVGEQAGRPLLDTVIDHLGDRRLLLLLDNCEHVVADAAQLVDAVLRACAGVTVLVTSQEPLAIPGEATLLLGPLAVPEEDAAADESAPAVRLFCERAAVARPSFALTPDIAPEVAEICRRLDGVALAIELAAARVAVLTPGEIAARLSDRFTLLTGGSRVGPARHQSLQAAIDWSHELCSERERALLRRLSVFAGGATLDAAVEVCAGRGVAAGEILTTVAALVARSLVIADTTGPRARYRLLETVRAYAADRLDEAGESAATKHRHAEWCAALVEEAEPRLTGGDQHRWLVRLEAEHANLRAALDWSIASADAVLALRLAGPLTIWWRVRGHFTEGRRYLEAALPLDAGVPCELRAKALWGLGFLAMMLGDTAVAMATLQESIDIYRELRDESGWARSALLLANCVVYFNPLGAQPLLEQSAALASGSGDDWCLSHALALAGLSHHLQGEPAAARPLLDQAANVARRSHDDQGLRIAYAILGEVAFAEGDHDTAEEALDKVLSVTGRLCEAYGAAVALVGLGEVALARGDYDTARRRLDEGTKAARSTATPGLITSALTLQAELALAEEDPDRARHLCQEAIAVAAGAGQDSPAARRGLGEVALASGDGELAGELLDDALERACRAKNEREAAAVQFDLAELAVARVERVNAVALHHQVLKMRRGLGDIRGVIGSLEALAAVAVDGARPRGAYAARLLGAVERLRGERRYARTPAQLRAHAATTARLGACLADAELEAAWAQGAELSVEDAVAYATKGRGARNRPATGLESLTRAERDVAALAAAGLSNPEIAQRLFIATWTVKGHLKRIFAKLGVSSRVDLARQWPPEAWAPAS